MHDSRLPAWAIERGRYLNSFSAIVPKRTALVVIDMQTAFLAPGAVFGNPYGMDIIPAVNQLAIAMRAAGCPILWTRQSVSDEPPLAMAPWQYDRADPHVQAAMEALTPGHSAHGLHPDMAVETGDVVLDKYRYSAFACPAGQLKAQLRERGIEMLVIAGTLTNVCCESTARDAYMRGYKVIAALDAMAAVTDEEHEAALLNLRLNFADVRESTSIINML
ncbi:nicotinamidase-related amidase [Sphingobium sp. B7D2B]|uniref:cysteine hydrolase family protein n=1 Tax=Sphingobium sp. B7D2B TaxID=2940583 RepID=UPI0022240124|nr:cysteine hydrolase [Sphingobium sp. B7D2B]MCW2365800.1 nicotinamidase-related amidase [Sphingobium sp. B7D2B]